MKILIAGLIILLSGCSALHKHNIVYSPQDYHVITIEDETGRIILSEPQESLHQCTMTSYLLRKQLSDIYGNAITDPLPHNYIVTCSLLK